MTINPCNSVNDQPFEIVLVEGSPTPKTDKVSDVVFIALEEGEWPLEILQRVVSFADYPTVLTLPLVSKSFASDTLRGVQISQYRHIDKLLRKFLQNEIDAGNIQFEDIAAALCIVETALSRLKLNLFLTISLSEIESEIKNFFYSEEMQQNSAITICELARHENLPNYMQGLALWKRLEFVPVIDIDEDYWHNKERDLDFLNQNAHVVLIRDLFHQHLELNIISQSVDILNYLILKEGCPKSFIIVELVPVLLKKMDSQNDPLVAHALLEKMMTAIQEIPDERISIVNQYLANWSPYVTNVHWTFFKAGQTFFVVGDKTYTLVHENWKMLPAGPNLKQIYFTMQHMRTAFTNSLAIQYRKFIATNQIKKALVDADQQPPHIKTVIFAALVLTMRNAQQGDFSMDRESKDLITEWLNHHAAIFAKEFSAYVSNMASLRGLV